MDLLFDDAQLKRVWNQEAIPVILRRIGKGEKLRVRLPYGEGNRKWLRNERRHRPEWIEELRCWELPKAWLNDFVDRALVRYRSVYIIQPYREQEKCSPACLNATGHDCECSCMGENHGAGNDGSWFEVSETFATRWGGPELACRLLTAKSCASAGDHG
ncbi:hypothetical protein [Mesorhizobium sp. LNHC252B00]|uniref:hypothetical protein n=1 Tax=Mesorhizobium sp. LNHC252B00 TaxID=1287252 RepID=UPI000400A6BD|nr:hypothetical protein [Mesorhizobium sp. LNHC252B00]